MRMRAYLLTTKILPVRYRDYKTLALTRNTSSLTRRAEKILGGGAFGGCKLLTEMQQIELPDGILEIGGNPLNETPVYTNAADRAAKNKTLFTFSVNGYLFKMTDTYIEEDKRPESVSIVGNVVAGGAVGLTSVQSLTVSDSVTYIGERAFRDCYSLVSIKLSENINEIHD